VVHVLILNSGSSSLKWTVLDAETEATIAQGAESWSGAEDGRHQAELGSVLAHAPPVDAIGHRVVHGGATLRQAVVVDQRTRQLIANLVELAPLHNPAALAGIKATERLLPGVPQVAAFDTAFHSTMPPAAAIYPLPWEWTERWDLRRLGFHGLSVQYAVQRATEMLGSLPARLVVCHLGAGCSITAVAMGRSVDTTMGFTPLEGLMMAVRSGSVDPGLLLYLLRDEHVSVQELEATLDGRSGLLGTSGISADLRAIIEAAQTGHERAQLALDMFVHRIIGAVGGMIGTLGGLDALVFTGGIGEHSPLIRQRVADSFGYFGLRLGPGPNAAVSSDADIATSESAARVLVISAREDLAILTEVKRLLWPAGRQGAT
jgi:acetate kinase